MSAIPPQVGPGPVRDGQILVSVVVPVYNESAVLQAFYDRASKAVGAIPNATYELVFVDDGSADDSFQQLAALAMEHPEVRVIRFSRNFGHQVAISAGVDYARGDCIVVIDSDLQDPPEVIQEMVAQWRAGYDVVYGVRRSRASESAFKKLTASLFYRLLNRMTRMPIPVDVGDFRLVSRRVADQLRQLREKDRFVRGLVSWIGYPQTGVLYDREPRFAGETKYPLRKMLTFAFDGITSFSTAPLRAANWLGYATSILAFGYLLDVLIQKWQGATVQGWATIMVAMLFLGGVQLVCLGIIGEYLGRVFNECKPRPMYIVQEVVNSPPQPTAAVMAGSQSQVPATVA